MARFDCTECPGPGEPGFNELREDLRTDVSIEGIRGLDRSEEECKEDFRSLLVLSNSFASLNMLSATQEFYNHFIDGDGSDYWNENLNNNIIALPEVENALKFFGDDFNSRINSDFTFDDISIALSRGAKPKFTNYRFSGYTILLNATESASFRILDWNVNQETGEWTAKVGVEIIDHFGLDRADIDEWQYKTWKYTGDFVTPQGQVSFEHVYEYPSVIGDGFSAWYLLQHKFKNKPFRTVIRFTADIRGNVNN